MGVSCLVYKLAALCSVCSLEQITPARINLDYYVNSLWSVLVGWLIALISFLYSHIVFSKLCANFKPPSPSDIHEYGNFSLKDVHLFPVYCSF